MKLQPFLFQFLVIKHENKSHASLPVCHPFWAVKTSPLSPPKRSFRLKLVKKVSCRSVRDARGAAESTSSYLKIAGHIPKLSGSDYNIKTNFLIE